MNTRRIYGWRPQVPDHRDFPIRFSLREVSVLPKRVDLRPLFPDCYDQGQIGSCTANAIAGALQYLRRKEGLTPDFVPSRLFIYYNERELENTVMMDAGAELRDGIKTIASNGVPDETFWPYLDTPANPMTNLWGSGDVPAIKPNPRAYVAASEHPAVEYLALNPALAQLQACLASGYPFVFGMAVYEAFESQLTARTGIVDMPTPTERNMGGHAVCCVGYDDQAQRFIVRNSWGKGWGQNGYFTIPYAYFHQFGLTSDFWTIRKAA